MVVFRSLHNHILKAMMWDKKRKKKINIRFIWHLKKMLPDDVKSLHNEFPTAAVISKECLSAG